MTKKARSVLVILNSDFSSKKQRLLKSYDVVIAPKDFEESAKEFEVDFVDIKNLIDPGNVREASQLVNELALIKDSHGNLLSKKIVYQGFELWWIHYDGLFNRFCFPYTRYGRLLDFLGNFSKVYLYKPPFSDLFRYYLRSKGLEYRICEEHNQKLPSFGVILQGLISVPFLFWLKIKRPKIMLWTNDMFDSSGDYDFRLKYIYKELRGRKFNFAEFIRSMESSPVIIKHAWKRQRPVLYSAAITNLVKFFSNLGNKRSLEESRDFWFLVANHYLKNVKGDIRAIRVMKFCLRFIGIKVAIIASASSRSFVEVLACKLLNIKTIGIQHGLSPRYYNVSEYMPGFNGKNLLTLDKYGLWSRWWKEHYLKYGQAYSSQQLFVSGPMRPLPLAMARPERMAQGGDRPKVLFVSEQLGDPIETIPFLKILVGSKDISFYIKFRSYRDGFEEWLKENDSEFLRKISPERIIRGDMDQAIKSCDIVVGSHSTGVMEALLQLKPIALFVTKKWGDYYDLKSLADIKYSFIANSPEELLKLTIENKDIPRELLEELRNRFFGDPYKNGSRWVVEQAENFLNKS